MQHQRDTTTAQLQRAREIHATATVYVLINEFSSEYARGPAHIFCLVAGSGCDKNEQYYGRGAATYRCAQMLSIVAFAWCDSFLFAATIQLVYIMWYMVQSIDNERMYVLDSQKSHLL